jgi:hypothetical protein
MGGRVALVLAFVIGSLTSCLIIGGELESYYPYTILAVLNTMATALTIGAVLSLPLFIASTAARFTVSYARSQEYPLLCVTTLSDDKIIMGHILAVLRYVRAPLALMLSLTPAFVIMLTYIAWLFSFSDYSPLAWYDGVLAATDLGIVGIVLKHTLLTIALSLGLLGINLLAATLGVGFGLWWRSGIPASAAALTTTVGSAAVLSYIVLRAAAVLGILDDFSRHLLQYVIFAPLPYLLALACVRLARRWVRKPD